MVELREPSSAAQSHRVLEQRLQLPSVDWATYRAVAEALSGRHVRLSYDGDRLEFMTISPLHGRLSRLLGRLIVAMTEEAGLPLLSFGDMTCEREDLGKGLEPDECFYITHVPAVQAKEKIDLTVDPPPDLAVEIDITISSRNRMAIYAALGVPEVWRFDDKTLVVQRLNDSGDYTPTDRSRYFPQLPVEKIADFLKQRARMDENTLLRHFRTWVRQQY